MCLCVHECLGVCVCVCVCVFFTRSCEQFIFVLEESFPLSLHVLCLRFYFCFCVWMPFVVCYIPKQIHSFIKHTKHVHLINHHLWTTLHHIVPDRKTERVWNASTLCNVEQMRGWCWRTSNILSDSKSWHEWLWIQKIFFDLILMPTTVTIHK